MNNGDNRIKEVTVYKNKYGVEFNVGDYVFLPLPFYDYGIWKIVKIYDETNLGRTRRLWLDQGDESEFNGKEGERHIRGMSIDNPFIKVDKECGEILFDNDEFKNSIAKNNLFL
jgi:hypothetical protein